jgi:RND superfamily putative drug exporter
MAARISPTSIGRWSTRRPGLAIALWLVFVLAAAAVLVLTGTQQLQNGAVGESARGDALLNAHQIGSPPEEYVYLHSSSLGTTSPVFRAALRTMSGELSTAMGGPVTVATSSDHHAALISSPDAGPQQGGLLQSDLARLRADYPQLQAVAGSGSGGSAKSDLARAEQLSVPVTLFVLVIAFGALVAALVPLLLAVTAVVAAFGLLGPISQVFPLDSSVKTVVLLIGMAVGVDYALFYVVRSREERRRGVSSHQALEYTAHTSGRSVVIAGTTVAVAMAAQFVIGSSIFNGIASGTIAVVACAVVGSVTVLPAVLKLVGPGIDRGRVRFLPQLATAGSSRFWAALVERVLRRPVLAAAASAGVLVALAVPAFGLHVAKPSSFALSAAGQSSLASQITREFPATSSPAIVVAAWSGQQGASVQQAANRLEALASSAGVAHPPFGISRAADGHALAIALPLTGLGDNPASRASVRTLRQQIVPATLGRISGVTADVTGSTAEDLDFTHQMTAGIPYVVAFVLGLAFVLLLVTFRSLVVPLKAIVLNLLSVGAAYGVLVLVFQHQWAQGLLGFQSNGAIISWLPLFLFVVLFGLSMDYHVFILSRVREGVDAGMSTDEALRFGVARTAGVVSSAALVMVAVFSLFATSSSLDLKEAGVGLAVAVLLDATVVRGVLLPASMSLLGERNWYLPAGLRWLPVARHQPTGAVPALASSPD